MGHLVFPPAGEIKRGKPCPLPLWGRVRDGATICAKFVGALLPTNLVFGDVRNPKRSVAVRKKEVGSEADDEFRTSSRPSRPNYFATLMHLWRVLTCINVVYKCKLPRFYR